MAEQFALPSNHQSPNLSLHGTIAAMTIARGGITSIDVPFPGEIVATPYKIQSPKRAEKTSCRTSRRCTLKLESQFARTVIVTITARSDDSRSAPTTVKSDS